MNNLPKVKRNNKACKLNGYSLFARELGGKKVLPGSDVNLSGIQWNIAKAKWDKISLSQKQEYNQRAKDLNIKLKKNVEKFNSLGERMVDIEKKDLQMEQEVDEMTKTIRTMITDAADCGDLDKLSFYFVSTSHFYKEADTIYPAELALAKFSLKEGVYAKISFPINPGNLPIGSRFTAQKLAEETHNYPLPENQARKTNYISLLTNILDFLHPLDRLPIFFAMGFRGRPKISTEIQVIEDTNQVLSYIFEQAGEYQIATKLKVYSVYELLFELKNKIVELKHKLEDFTDGQFTSIPYTIDQFKMADSTFENLTKGCSYHNELPTPKQCCLSKVQRFGFVLTQWCNQMEKTNLKPDRHFPYVESDKKK